MTILRPQLDHVLVNCSSCDTDSKCHDCKGKISAIILMYNYKYSVKIVVKSMSVSIVWE